MAARRLRRWKPGWSAARVAISFIEVHISNIHAREAFRRESVMAPIAIGQLSGLGTYGYELALDAMIHYLQTKKR
jgi:3-dehydroquinate dehydratase-2